MKPLMQTRDEAGLADPLRPLLDRTMDPMAFSIHGAGDSNLREKWMRIPNYWVKRIQQIHQGNKSKGGLPWRDMAYAISISYLGMATIVHNWDQRSFAEGTLQRNRNHDYPDFLPEPDGKISGNDYFLPIFLECVGISRVNVKPYTITDAFGKPLHIPAIRKGEMVNPSAPQMKTLDAMIQYARVDIYNTMLPVHGHGDHRIKECPYTYIWDCIEQGRWEEVRPVPAPVIAQEEPESQPVPKPFELAAEYAQPAQMWGVEAGITDGQRPSDNITREELWATLHRYDALRFPSMHQDNPPVPFDFTA